jgi:hypothetical protein
MRYYAISELELKQFHMAGLVAGGGDAVLPVVNSIRERKISYAAESQKPAHNTASDAIALWVELLTAGKNGVSFETWLRDNYQRVAAACAQRHA